MKPLESKDVETSKAFASSWNNLPQGSVYTFDQFQNWLDPLTKQDVVNKNILELGCGNASILFHLAKWNPKYIEGVDLGESVVSANKSMTLTTFNNWKIIKDDLTTYRNNIFDLVLCIGVLHHLNNPKEGFDSVIANTKKGGRFHCWVYAKEGNLLVIKIVEPIRKISSKLPWWVTKYLIATPLVIPYYFYAKILFQFKNFSYFKNLPLFKYSIWIAKRNFLFFQHVAFDQLVTPQTTYIRKSQIENWLKHNNNIDQSSTYIINRNDNSWKFGGKTKY